MAGAMVKSLVVAALIWIAATRLDAQGVATAGIRGTVSTSEKSVIDRVNLPVDALPPPAPTPQAPAKSAEPLESHDAPAQSAPPAPSSTTSQPSTTPAQ